MGRSVSCEVQRWSQAAKWHLSFGNIDASGSKFEKLFRPRSLSNPDPKEIIFLVQTSDCIREPSSFDSTSLFLLKEAVAESLASLQYGAAIEPGASSGQGEEEIRRYASFDLRA
jgi:hypothetical protein